MKVNPDNVLLDEVKEIYKNYCKERNIAMTTVNNMFIEQYLLEQGLIDKSQMRVNQNNYFGKEIGIRKPINGDEFITFRVPVLKEIGDEFMEFCNEENLKLYPMFQGIISYILRKGKLHVLEQCKENDEELKKG